MRRLAIRESQPGLEARQGLGLEPSFVVMRKYPPGLAAVRIARVPVDHGRAGLGTGDRVGGNFLRGIV